MANGGLSWVNSVLGATVTATSEVSTLPLSNLQDDHVAIAYRSADASDLTIDFDLGSAVTIALVGLFGCNFTSAATWRIEISIVSAGGTDAYDSGVVAANVASGYGQTVKVLPAPVVGRYVRIILSDSGLASVGYFQIGSAWIGALWQPAKNFSYGQQIGRVDPSVKSKSRGGQLYIDVRDQYRTHQFTMDFLTETEIYDEVFELDRVAGTSSNILWVPDPSGTRQNRQAIFGTLTDLAPAANPFFATFSRQYQIEERL